MLDIIVLSHFTENYRLTRQSFIIFNNSVSSFHASYCTSLRRFYNTYFLVSVFNPIKCLHDLSIGLEKVYPTFLKPVWAFLFRLRCLTWSFFILVIRIQLHVNTPSDSCKSEEFLLWENSRIQGRLWEESDPR